MRILTSVFPLNFGKNLLKNNKGFGVIEAAILLPIFLIIIFAGIEFGRYFATQAVAQRAVSNVSITTQTTNPNSTATDADVLNNNLNNLTSSLGVGVIDFTVNNICGRAFATQADAQNFVDSTNPCSASGFQVGRFNAPGSPPPNTPYFVGVVAKLPYSPLTGLSSLSGVVMPDNITAKSVILVSAVIGSGLSTPPNCTSANKALHWNSSSSSWSCDDISTGSTPTLVSCGSGYVSKWDGLNWSCVNLSGLSVMNPPTCSTGQSSKWVGASWQCVNVITAPSCSANQAIYWNGSSWACASAATIVNASGCKVDVQFTYFANGENITYTVGSGWSNAVFINGGPRGLRFNWHCP